MKISVNIKMDEQIRDQAKILFAKMGLDMTTAVNMFLIQAIREKQIPFQISANDKENTFESIEKFVGLKLKEAEIQEANAKMRNFENFAKEINSKYGF